ncbi:MAG: flavin reductase [Phenylobacterium sp.]|uniref:flavin reductase family protein n=1 Tax=Phenylobacterium sp. TaxID=1871053 RepID=UPI0025DAFADB|nr:flavin reductase family protein [Phenylobacterium sp.]MBA4010306.1 flavin reductase [Phenylobacterium sp.]
MADGSVRAASAAEGTCDVVRLWPPVDEAAFRDGLAKLASGVAVVACWTPEGPRGLLVSSLTGLSSDPPRILFCVRKAASAHQALLHADAVSLSILADDDQAEAERFSRPDRAGERFAADRWALQPQSPPAYRQALVSLAGPVCCRIDAASHTVFILDVSDARTQGGAPLLYFERGFHQLA